MKLSLALASVIIVSTLGGCVQIEAGAIKGPLPRVATNGVAVFENEALIGSAYTLIDDIHIDYEDNSRKFMLERLRSLAGQKGANAIILDRDFPRQDGTRDLSGLYLTNPEPKPGARAIYIGQLPPRRRYEKLP